MDGGARDEAGTPCSRTVLIETAPR